MMDDGRWMMDDGFVYACVSVYAYVYVSFGIQMNVLARLLGPFFFRCGSVRLTSCGALVSRYKNTCD